MYNHTTVQLLNSVLTAISYKKIFTTNIYKLRARNLLITNSCFLSSGRKPSMCGIFTCVFHPHYNLMTFPTPL